MQLCKSQILCKQVIYIKLNPEMNILEIDKHTYGFVGYKL